MRYLLILLLCLQGCTLFRTEIVSEKKIETTTETVEYQETLMPDGSIANLKKTIYTTELSKEVASAKQSVQAPIVTTIGGAVAGFTGMGGLVDTAIIALSAAAGLKTKQVIAQRWNANRNQPAPDDPRLNPNVKVIRKEDEDASNRT